MSADEHIPHVLPSRPLFVGAGVVGALLVGAAASQQPLLVVLALLLLLGGASMLLWPELPTLFVLFALYTNAAVVAVKYHGVPFVIGAALPLLLLIPLAEYLLFQRRPLRFAPAFPLIVLFFGVQLIGALLTRDIRLGLSGLMEYAIEGVGIFFLLTNVIRTRATLRRAIWALLLAGLLIGALSLVQQVTGTFDRDYGGFAQSSGAAFGTGQQTLLGEVTQPRLQGPVGEKNRFAQIMLMLVPLGLFRFWHERNWALRGLALLATLLSAAGMALTFSRGAALAFVLMLGVMGLLGQLRLRHLALVGLLVLLLLTAFPQYGARLATLQGLSGLVGGARSSEDTPDGALVGRATEMTTALLVFVDHPIVGVGPRMFGHYYQDYVELAGPRRQVGTRQAHNLFLGILAETGLLGLLCFGGIMAVTLWELLAIRNRFARSDPELASIATSLFLALITYLGTGMGLHFAYIRYFWLMMALAGATQLIAARQPEPITS